MQCEIMCAIYYFLGRVAGELAKWGLTSIANGSRVAI